MNVTEKLKVAENYQILLLFRREHLKPVEFNLLSQFWFHVNSIKFSKLHVLSVLIRAEF